MIRELDVVALTKRLPDHRLELGYIGTVVMIHGDGRGFEVEFATLGGETLAVVTLPTAAVRPLRPTEVASARDVA